VRWALLVALVACTAHVDGPADEHAARDRTAGAELAAHLTALPGVARASALVHTPWSDPLAAAPPPDRIGHPSASIALAAAPGADTVAIERDARALAAAALRADPRDVAIAVEAPPPAAALAHVGPFEVAASDRTALAVTLVVALAAIAGLAGWLAAVQLRAQRRRGPRA
jgi:hypothetical protein